MMEKNGEGFIDRSKVKILLCDNDAKSSQEIFTLLTKCSYQVISVRSPRQVIDALNAERGDIDIILSELDLPMSRGSKMLRYIMRDKELRRIPIIMMSARDEVSTVVKCLKLGAADYLVKPLRVNELLNLWTHMWRRRRMLGLSEKNIMNYEFDLVVTDPSDANTNSTTLFSDDTDDRSWKSVHPDTCVSNLQEGEIIAATTTAPIEPPARDLLERQPNVPGIVDWQTGQISLFRKKTELKIGESSAFFTYVKSSLPKTKIQGSLSINKNVHQDLNVEVEEKLDTAGAQENTDIQRHANNKNVYQDPSVDGKLDTAGARVNTDTQRHANNVVEDNHTNGDDYPSSNSFPDSFSAERSYTPPSSLEFSHGNSNEFSQVHLHSRSEPHHDVSGFQTHTPYPYYISGAMNQVMMASSQMYQKNLPDLNNHANSTVLPQYNHIPQFPPHVPGMGSFPYYPIGLCLQPGQTPTPHPWASYQSPSSANGNGSKVDRREAALMKFRQKRKERCFNKKIRYVNRKQLAERRPRVRGQFVKKVNGINVDLNGHPAPADDDDDEDADYEDDQATNVYSSQGDDTNV